MYFNFYLGKFKMYKIDKNAEIIERILKWHIM